MDSLSRSFTTRADTLPAPALPELELEIRDWLARLQYEDQRLLPPGGDKKAWFRAWRGRLYDALGWAAFRGGDYREAEAALVSARDEIHSWGTTAGYARHFYHLGRLYAARGRWRQAAEAYLDAETRGLGSSATPELETAWRRAFGSLAGLDAARDRERARIEDERRQEVLAGRGSRPLPPFTWPRRTGPPLASATLVGSPLVIATWGPDCAGCAAWPAGLEELATALRARGGSLVGVWLGADPAGAGPPRPWIVLVPSDPAVARATLGADSLPLLLVVDAGGRIRYRHAGRAATPPPTRDILLQIDHLSRTTR